MHGVLCNCNPTTPKFREIQEGQDSRHIGQVLVLARHETFNEIPKAA